jgi:Bardet-Biedl syndrome 1 protein
MFTSFQDDLNKLKFKTFDTYSKLIVKGHAPQNYSTVSKLKLNVSLQGLGPQFRLLITVDNSGEDVINSVDLIVDYDKKIYDFPKESVQLGLLMPNVPTKYALKFKNITESGSSGNVKLMIVDKTSTAPLIVNIIKVPVSELELI